MRALHALSLSYSLATLAPFATFAQTGPRVGVASETTSSSRYFTEVSYVLPSTLSLGSTDFGDVDTFATQVSYQTSLPTSECFSWLLGFELQGTWFDRPDASPIPQSLYETSLRIGAVWRFSPKATLQVLTSPGAYSDFKDFDADDFKVPVLALVFWDVNERLQLVAGAAVDNRRDVPVIPAIGGRWRFADNWTLLAVFPTPRIEYAVNESLTTFFGAELVRSAYRVAEDFGDRFGRPELNDQDLSYNEWRVGAGARWRFCRAFTVSLDAGWMGEREFNFDDRDVTLTSEGAPYAQLSFSGSY